MDIVASLYGRNNLAHIVEETIEKDFFIPITVGGGIRSLEDINTLLRSGADKVAINTAAINRPDLLKEAAEVFGSSTIVLSVEAKKISSGKWEAYTDNGREQTGLDAIEWVKKAIGLGVGEIFITSVDREGMRNGYDLELIEEVTAVSSVPVVVSGGAGSVEHVKACLENQKIDGIAVASLFHYNELKVSELKENLSKQYKEKINNNYYHEVKQESKKDIEVSIVDYNLGNLRSVINALKQIGARPKLISTAEEILKAEYIILPGVGAFVEGMLHLKKNGLDKAIQEYVQKGKPLLGICLGMQLLMTKSYEFGEYEGLNLIEGAVLPFEKNEKLAKMGYKIPHVGWNQVSMRDNNFMGIGDLVKKDMDAYFVHSFYVKPDKEENIFAVTKYFDYEFCSMVRKNNIYGCQFHPEKSGERGLSILREFIKTALQEGVMNV